MKILNGGGSGGGGGGTVTGVTGVAPITSTGGTAPAISTSLATNKLLGRATAGTGVAEEITLGTNLSFTGTTLNATGGSGTPGGSTTQVQFNDAGAFGGDADLTWNKTTNVLGITGDVNLSDGGTYTTTLQTITPTAARTISLPDATGTVALVAGSSGQLLYNNAGVNAGASTLTYDGSILTTSGRFINSYNATASSPAKLFTGTWFTGGTSTTTKPQVLIEPTGATSTAWSTNGTGLGVNAASGFTGNLLDLQVNGTKSLVFYRSGTSNLIGNGPTQADQFVGWVNNLFTVSHYGTNITYNSSVFAVTANSSTFSGSVTIGGDVTLVRDAADTLAQRRTTNAQTFRVYGTFTDASNHVRAALSSTSTAVTLAAETAGTGADNIPLNLTAAGTGTIKVNSVAEVVVSSTVAGLPAAPVVGMLTRVTDATAPVVGMTVAGGGAAAALVWYNGTNWSVIGV
jgi:hypothetical protein